MPVSYSLTHLASFVGMACKTWLHSFSFVPILHRRSSTLPAMSHLLNRSSQSGRLFSSSANRPSPPTTPVHAQAKRGFSSKNDDVAVASRTRTHTHSLSLSLSKYWTWWSSESDFVINYYWICSFCCCCCLFWISWGCSVWSAIENSGISRPYSESEEQANRFVRR